MKNIWIVALVVLMASCKSNSQQVKSSDMDEKVEVVQKPEEKKETSSHPADETSFKDSNGKEYTKVKKSVNEWRKILNDIEYYVLREEGTERSFTSDLLENKKEGVYTCKGCDLPLFASETKYKSGTGWPSFYQPIDDAFITENTDYKIGYARTEVECRRCGGHLGHVFNDGPQPTGLRYCINGVSLDFVEKK